MSCKRCNSEREATVDAKCSDLCNLNLGNREIDGYVPSDMGIGGGDYIEFSYCLDCGQIQGEFPLPETKLEEEEETEEE